MRALLAGDNKFWITIHSVVPIMSEKEKSLYLKIGNVFGN